MERDQGFVENFTKLVSNRETTIRSLEKSSIEIFMSSKRTHMFQWRSFLLCPGGWTKLAGFTWNFGLCKIKIKYLIIWWLKLNEENKKLKNRFKGFNNWNQISKMKSIYQFKSQKFKVIIKIYTYLKFLYIYNCSCWFVRYESRYKNKGLKSFEVAYTVRINYEQ